MIYAKDLKEYVFDSIEQYFEYIIESKENGNKMQAYHLYHNLSKKQKLSFFEHVNDNYNDIWFELMELFER